MTQEFSSMGSLLEMLRFARPHASAVEAQFVQRFIDPLGVSYDKFGNAYKRIGTAPILWSCHTDTVHHKQGMQQVKVEKGIASLVGGARGDCLGADDGAGVWIMSEMILAHVPGLYVFHAGEEHGGLGSKFIARERGDFLSGMKAAIAFDRKGTRDVITHQGGARCCSAGFARSMAEFLGMKYGPDSTGTFTDTANYVDLIGECTNISVGYEGAHSWQETLDTKHLRKLRDRMLRFDPSCLTYERQPGDADPDEWPLGGDGASIYGYDEELIELVYDHPEIAAGLLESMGFTVEDMKLAIDAAGYGRRA